MSARLEIDLDAFRANVRTLAERARPARTMIAVKADAYGHGMLPFARAALEAGAEALGVLEVDAALDLRAAGITAPLFAWLHGADTDFPAAVAAGVDLGVSTLRELERAAATGAGAARLHLKIDTGLHRNGASPEAWPALVAAAVEHAAAGRVVLAGLWSHLADASPEADAAALAEFQAAVALARGLGVPESGPDAPLLHLAASSAGIREPEARFDQVRFGIAAYGVSPFDDVDGRGLGLRGALRLVATVTPAGAGRGALDLGAADGLPPGAAGRASVLVAGARCPVLEIGIDESLVALPAEVTLPAEATIYGPGDDGEPTAEEWAAWGDTIGDEILARASRRIPRILLGE